MVTWSMIFGLTILHFKLRERNGDMDTLDSDSVVTWDSLS